METAGDAGRKMAVVLTEAEAGVGRALTTSDNYKL